MRRVAPAAAAPQFRQDALAEPVRVLQVRVAGEDELGDAKGRVLLDAVGDLAQGDRYERARTFLRTTGELRDSWRGDEVTADKDSGQFLSTPVPGAFEHHDKFFDIAGSSTSRARRRAAR